MRGAAEFDEFAQQMIQQIQHMAADVEKEPAAGLCDIQPPETGWGGTIRRAAVVSTRGHAPDFSGVDQLFGFHKSRERATVVRDEQWKLGALKCVDHSLA